MPLIRVFSSVHPAGHSVNSHFSEGAIAAEADLASALVQVDAEISVDDLSQFEIIQNQHSAWEIRFDSGSPPQRIWLILTGANMIHTTLFDNAFQCRWRFHYSTV